MHKQVMMRPQEGEWQLVADIGGTNARFGLASGGANAKIEVDEIRTFECADYPTIEAALTAYLDSVPGDRRRSVREACVAIAGPTEDDVVAVTNLSWRFSKSHVGEQLGYRRFEVINDFAALALSCAQLDSQHLTRVDRLGAASGAWDRSAPRVVIGPGTGLGVCGLLRSGDGWRALPGEGGHAAIAPATEEEFGLFRVLRRERSHLSAEDLLSGRGLQNIYRGLATLCGVEAVMENPAAISAAALAGECTLARDAVLVFCALLGSFCGDVALTIGARGGVYLGGGILPRIEALLRDSDFEQRLRSKGVMSGYLEHLPVFLVSHPFPALSGAAAFLRLDG
ncbi:glucokinase [Microbulbifer guangxiensis]|uniref:glucokinase n=1 Tax=Microbulbifer guangxiensis TaxID=2904249 RepID=UPI001F000FD0|nr:glucokinase [Microbulbifer guangxiensis]